MSESGVKTIDLTPKWIELTPFYLNVLKTEDVDTKAYVDATLFFIHMAKAADTAVEMQKQLNER